MRVLLFVLFLLLAFDFVNSAAIKTGKDRRTHEAEFRRVCKRKTAQRYFEWEPCHYKIRGKQNGKMEHYEVKNGKCVRLITNIIRTCPHPCPDKKVWAEFCRRRRKNGKYKNARGVKIITYRKIGRICLKSTAYKVESCAKYVPWIKCPAKAKMEMGECKKSKGSKKGFRRVLVKVYSRKSLTDTACKSVVTKKIEMCDYKKERRQSRRRVKKSKKAEAARRAAKKARRAAKRAARRAARRAKSP